MSKKIIFTEQQICQIKEMYNNGLNARKIAKTFGISFNPINNLLNRLKIPRLTGPLRTSPEIEKEIINLYTKEKLSSVIISQRLGVSKQCVLRTLNRNGIDRRINAKIKRKIPRIAKDILFNLYINKKMTIKAIGIELDATPATVQRWLVYHSITLRKEKLSKFLLKTLIIKLIRSRLVEWKENVKDRDSHMCQKCGNKENLEVHHLISLCNIVKQFIRRHKDVDFNINENINFAVNSIVKTHSLELGITLCEVCHCEVDNARRNFS